MDGCRRPAIAAGALSRRQAGLLLMSGVMAPTLHAAVPAPPADLCTTPATDGRPAPRPVAVAVPELTLRAASGEPVPLARLLAEREAVLLNFVFTSCTTICPPMTQVFAATQDRLGARMAGLRLVSVSIDPEQDTPRRLQAYAERFGAGPQWTFLTGQAEAIRRVQRAFQVWQPDKMGHVPLTFWKPAGGSAWWRLDGLATPEHLVRLVTAAAAR